MQEVDSILQEKLVRLDEAALAMTSEQEEVSQDTERKVALLVRACRSTFLDTLPFSVSKDERILKNRKALRESMVPIQKYANEKKVAILLEEVRRTEETVALSEKGCPGIDELIPHEPDAALKAIRK